jgi:hypothetical protein
LNWGVFATNPWTITIGGGLIVAGVSFGFKSVRQFWLRHWASFRSKPFVPRETFRVVQDSHQSHWSLASSAGIPSMMVVFQGHVTNISGRANRVLRVEIPKPLTHATLLHLHNDYGARREQFLNPFENTNISAVFFVQPVVARAGEKWTSTLIFIDQYNNRHKVKNCVFRGLAPPPQETNAPAH